MNLSQILTLLELLGYDRYRLEGNPLGWPPKIICSIFKSGEIEPDVTVVAPYELQALRVALRQAREKTRRNQ